VSGGGDGTLAIWDVEKRGKCKSWDKLGRPITAAQFNRDGRLLAYSLSYDWGKVDSDRRDSKAFVTNQLCRAIAVVSLVRKIR